MPRLEAPSISMISMLSPCSERWQAAQLLQGLPVLAGGETVDGSRQDTRSGSLAGAAWSAEKISVDKAPPADSGGEHLGDMRLADQS